MATNTWNLISFVFYVVVFIIFFCLNAAPVSGQVTKYISCDDKCFTGPERWCVWTQFNGHDFDLWYNRKYGGSIVETGMVHVGNTVDDMDGAIAPCFRCSNPWEKLWTVWERIDPVKHDTDIIAVSRSFTSTWGHEILPHYNNDYDDFNPDVLGDSDGNVWIVWVVYDEIEYEYQLRYTFYDGDTWYADIVAHIGDLYEGSEPQIFEVTSHPPVKYLTRVKVQWRDESHTPFDIILAKPY